jgi:hypothetical protein
MKHKVDLSDADLRLLIAGLDLVARNLGAGQQQNGLQALEEVQAKSMPVLKLASRLSTIVKPEIAEPPPAVAATPAKPVTRAERRAAAKR